MSPKSVDTLLAFIASLPKDIRLFVELRHHDWFKTPEVFNKTTALLEENGAGLVVTDVAGRRDCVHMRLTTREVFIRFNGNGLHPSDYTRIDDWVTRLKSWSNQGIERVYFFMHQEDEIHSPELCKYVIEKLNAVCNANLTVPKFVEAI